MGDTIMAYGTLLTDTIQSSVASTAGTLGTPPQFNDANGVQTGTLCRAWVNFNGTLTGTNPPRASFNVSSVTRHGTGDYTVNFTNAMPDANYSVSGATGSSIPATSAAVPIAIHTLSTGAARLVKTAGSGGTPYDADTFTIAIFR